jgi:hypothetical protein
VKRHPALVPLSDDHHRALVLARRLRRFEKGALPEALDALSREVRRELARDLEPHFRAEEQALLPALEARGGEASAERIRQDHARLRALVRGPWSPHTPEELGSLLEGHVRFEDRVAFPEAEAILSAAELDAIREASEGGASPA